MKPQLTLTFESLEDLSAFLLRATQTPGKEFIRGIDAAIEPIDRPDCGLDTAAIFGGQAAPLAPVAAAPSSAAVVPSSTAPVAPPVSSPVAPPAPPAPAPMPAPAAVAPTAPAAPPSHAGVELDKDGLPWDARIHSESRKTIADGTWRQRRNLDPTVKAAVEAELRGLMALNAGAVPPVPPAAPQATIPAPPAVAAPQPPAPAPVPAAAPGASPSSSPTDIGGLMTKLAPYFATGALTNAKADEICARHGLTNMSQAVLTPALVPALNVDFSAALGIPA